MVMLMMQEITTASILLWMDLIYIRLRVRG